MTHLFAVFQKELLLQWRSRAQAISVVVFGATTLLLFSFGIGPNTAQLRQYAPSFLWLALLLSSTLSFAESFKPELEERALDGLRLLPIDPKAIFYGKALANLLMLLLTAIAILPVLIALYDASIPAVGSFALVLFLGCAGLAAPGTLYAAMSGHLRAASLLLRVSSAFESSERRLGS